MIQTIFGSPVVILKSHSTKELFPDEVYNEIVEYMMITDNKFVEHPYARGGKICTTDLNDTISEKINCLNILLEFLKETGLKYAYLYSDQPVIDLEFYNTWINLSFQGCEIKNHYDRYHENYEKSLVILFYPRAPKGGSNLVFIHNSKYGDWIEKYPENDLVRIGIEEGDIVIIDNGILHAVDAHNVVDPRMCIAVEFRLL
jgi:hypothetical protein